MMIIGYDKKRTTLGAAFGGIGEDPFDSRLSEWSDVVNRNNQRPLHAVASPEPKKRQAEICGVPEQPCVEPLHPADQFELLFA